MQILISARDKATRVVRGVSKGLKKLGTTAKRMGKSMVAAFGRMAKSLISFKAGLIAVAGVAGMGLLVKSSLDAVDKLSKVASKLGVTTQELQRFRLAAKLAGVEESALDMGLQRFIRRVGEAAQGTGEAKDALLKMGIQLTNSNGKVRSATNLLGQVSNALMNTKDPAERLRLAFKLFDSEGVAMVNMLKNGKNALFETMGMADKLGIVLSEKTVANVVKANDAFFLMGKAMGAVKDRMTGALAPALERFAKWWSEFTVGFSAQIKPLWEFLEKMLAKVTGGFGDATMAGREFGNTVGFHVAEAALWLEKFFTKLDDGESQAQKTWASIVNGANTVVNVIKQISSAINSVVQAFKHLKDFSKFMLGMMPGQIFGGDIESGNDSLKKQSNNSSSNSQSLSSISNTSSTVTNIYTNATAHGINNALGTRGDNISRGARIGMNLAKGNLTGGYGNLSMTRAR